MEHVTRLFVATLLAVGIGALAMPNTAIAQPPGEGEDDCTMKCGCIKDEGCGCQMDGGNGWSCDASGNGCFVHECNPHEFLASAFIAPDGTVFQRRTDADGIVIETVAAGSWETLQNGITVAKNCAGFIVSRYLTPGLAAEIRRETRIIAAQS